MKQKNSLKTYLRNTIVKNKETQTEEEIKNVFDWKDGKACFNQYRHFFLLISNTHSVPLCHIKEYAIAGPTQRIQATISFCMFQEFVSLNSLLFLFVFNIKMKFEDVWVWQSFTIDQLITSERWYERNR